MNASADLNKDALNMSGFSGSAFDDDITNFDGEGSGNNSFKFDDIETEGNVGAGFFASFEQPSGGVNMLF